MSAHAKSLLLVLSLLLADAVQANDTVVLLHGLARSADSMNKLEKALKRAGYNTCNIDYPSTRFAIATLATEHVLPKIRECIKDSTAPLHFVTHSLGGIVVRQLQQSASEQGASEQSASELQFGRVVMLGPPNHGSELVDAMRDWKLFRWVNGPAGQQLGTEAQSVPNQLGPVTFELGVIAGNKPFMEPFVGYIKTASDGKVSVASAKLDGMQDFIELPVTHSLMMRDKAVIAQAVQFLQTGKFTVTAQVISK